MGRLSAIMLILPSSMGAGWILGYLMDRLFGTFPLAGIVMTLLCAGAGFYQIARILALDQRDHDGGPSADKS
jgi:F0F1-type ATP synthase assembly protein I